LQHLIWSNEVAREYPECSEAKPAERVNQALSVVERWPDKYIEITCIPWESVPPDRIGPDNKVINLVVV
jgi:hypothetical protein